MIFQVVSPIVMSINGDNLKSAIKNFIKTNHALRLQNIIVKDQNKHYEAVFKYHKNSGRNKVGINIFPSSSSIVTSPTIISTIPSIGPTIITPTVPTASIIATRGPIVGNQVDMGPTVANVVSPIGPTIVSTNPIVTSSGSNIATTANSILIGSEDYVSPISPFIPSIISINH